MKFTTLCYLERGNEYLMLHRTKKKLDFNKDMWIGVGGHFEENESPDDCLVREVKEETGLTLTSYRMRGILTFVYRDICEYTCLYTADGFEGEMITCNEGDLEWIPKDKLLTLGLFEGDLIFFKLLLEDAPFFSLKLTYDQVNEHRLIDAELNGKKLELFDILDENGVPTGLTRERSLCHLLGTPHRTGHVWIVRRKNDCACQNVTINSNNNIAKTSDKLADSTTIQYELLLQKRSHDKDSFPDCYDISSAGHVPAGSSVLDSAIRELSEELGIKASPDDLVPIGTHEGNSHSIFYGKPFHNHEFSILYLYTRPVQIEDLVLQESEIQSVKWFDLNQLMEDVKNDAPGYCLYYDELQILKTALDNR